MKQYLISALFLFLIVQVPVHKVFAQCPTTNPGTASEIQSAVSTNAAQVKSLTSVANEKDKDLQAKAGNTKCPLSPKSTQGVKSTAYEWLREKVLLAPDSKILPAQTDYDKALSLIQEKLFMAKEDEESSSFTDKIAQIGGSALYAMTGFSTTKATQIKKDRDAYLKEVSTRVMAVMPTAQKKLKEDKESVAKTKTRGCNALHSYMYQNRNLLALIKSTAARITVQVMKMETDTVDVLMNEPMQLLSLQDTTEKK